jgi:transposase
VAKPYQVTYRNGQWHVAFAVKPDPLPGPGTGEAIGIDRGVVITAALSDGRNLNCPQLTSRERARLRKHQRRAARAPKDSPQKAAEYAAVARIKAREAGRCKDWCETSTMLATGYDVIRFEKLNIVTMTASACGTRKKPGRNVAQKAGPRHPRPGLGPAPGPHRKQGPRTSTSRPGLVHQPAVQCLRVD